MSNKIEQALKNLTRMSSYDGAQRWANNQIKLGFILLGDDGKYWVTANLRDGQILQRAGSALSVGLSANQVPLSLFDQLPNTATPCASILT